MLRPDVAVLHHAWDQRGVDQPSNAKETEGHEEQHAAQRSIQVKSMPSEDADEEPEDVREEDVLLSGHAGDRDRPV